MENGAARNRQQPRPSSTLPVPTVSFRVWFVFVVLAHQRRRIVHFNVTQHPTAAWTGQQMMEAFPEDTAPRYLLRDRDKIYGEDFRQRIQGLSLEEVLSAPASPWQRAYVERLIGVCRQNESLSESSNLNRQCV